MKSSNHICNINIQSSCRLMKEPLEGDFNKGSVKKVKKINKHGNRLKFQKQIIIQNSIKKLVTWKVAGLQLMNLLNCEPFEKYFWKILAILQGIPVFRLPFNDYFVIFKYVLVQLQDSSCEYHGMAFPYLLDLNQFQVFLLPVLSLFQTFIALSIDLYLYIPRNILQSGMVKKRP